MYRVRLTDIGNLFKTVRDVALLKNLVTNGTLVYATDDNTASAYYVRINNSMCEAHVESTSKCRGYKLKRFLIESGIATFKSDDNIKSIINFVDEGDKALQLFISTISDRGGKVNDKIMYVSERQKWLEV